MRHVVAVLLLLTTTSIVADQRRDESMRELEKGRALLEKLQKASGLDQALYASQVKGAFEKAVELDPANVEARVSLASYYMNAPFIAGGSYKKAKKEAEAIIALDPVRGHLLMAEIYSQEKEWPDAIAEIERAAAIDPKNARTHFTAGRAYQQMERWPQAAAAFEKAVALDANFGDAWYQIGRTAATSGENLNRGLEALDIYIDRFAESGGAVFHAGAWWRRGSILEKLGKREEAAAAYRQSLAIRQDERVAAALKAVTEGQ